MLKKMLEKANKLWKIDMDRVKYKENTRKLVFRIVFHMNKHFGSFLFSYSFFVFLLMFFFSEIRLLYLSKRFHIHNIYNWYRFFNYYILIIFLFLNFLFISIEFYLLRAERKKKCLRSRYSVCIWRDSFNLLNCSIVNGHVLYACESFSTYFCFLFSNPSPFQFSMAFFPSLFMLCFLFGSRLGFPSCGILLLPPSLSSALYISSAFCSLF